MTTLGIALHLLIDSQPHIKIYLTTVPLLHLLIVLKCQQSICQNSAAFTEINYV